jgi:hypothetical protein
MATWKNKMMRERQDVYVAFRKAQSLAKNRGYRLPKDWDTFYKKLSLKNRNTLTQITHWFNTKWKDIDPQKYFDCGFELFGKSFSYHKFAERPIINLYIQRDKAVKRDMKMSKKSIALSTKWVLKYMKESDIPTFFVYCNSRIGNRLLPIDHYLKNKIDGIFLTWLIKDKMIGALTDDERATIPYITENYRENVLKLEQIQDFLRKLRAKI